MFKIAKKEIYPIGIEFCINGIKLSQLAHLENNNTELIDYHYEQMPAGIESGSVDWQKWAIESIKKALKDSEFKGKKASSSIVAKDIFIDHLKLPASEVSNADEYILGKIKNKLSFEAQNTLLKYVVSDSDKGSKDKNAVIMATDKVKVERYLAILESAKLEIESLSVWPMALTKSFVNFFGRRESDNDKNVILVNICRENSGVVITRHDTPLFARYMGVGSSNSQTNQQIIDELKASVRYFKSWFPSYEIERMIVMSRSSSVSEDFISRIAELAKELNVLAQLGDVCDALKGESNQEVIESIPANVDMSIPFGLSYGS